MIEVKAEALVSTAVGSNASEHIKITVSKDIQNYNDLPEMGLALLFLCAAARVVLNQSYYLQRLELPQEYSSFSAILVTMKHPPR